MKKNLRKALGLLQTHVIEIDRRLVVLQALVDELSGKPSTLSIGGGGSAAAFTLKADGTLVQNTRSEDQNVSM